MFMIVFLREILIFKEKKIEKLRIIINGKT